METWNTLSSAKPVSAFSIFCGVLEYSEDIMEQIQAGETFGFSRWETHVKIMDMSSVEILKSFNRFYYESFVNTIFPNVENREKQYYNEEFADHTIRLSKKIDNTIPVSFRRGKEKLVFDILFEYLDLYFFPHGIVLYCFKCNLNDFTFDQITLINSQLRNIGENPDTLFLRKLLSFLNPVEGLQNEKDFVTFGNKLKVYSMIEHNENLSEIQENNLLYDIAICAPIGSAAGANSFFSPSDDYYQELMENNRISVFKNWTGMALVDTFICLFRKGALDHFTWEIAYFNLLYIHSLYVKNFLFKMNKEFYVKGANHQELEDQFFDFNKYYNQSHISYNFLPPIIYNKILFSLAINEELSLMKDGIERANLKFKEKRDKMINDILTIIALLTIFSVIWDLSEWVNKLISGEVFTYNLISGSLTGLVTITLIMFLIKNYKRKH
jgi:hypothetical protein